MSDVSRLSIVIPAHNEEVEIERTLSQFAGMDGIDVVVSIGQSTDATGERAAARGAAIINGKAGRGTQMNAGAALARADTLLFLHADTLLPEGFVDLIENALSDGRVSGGAFRLGIEGPGAGLRLVERAANLRSRLLQLPYGDQALFMRRRHFDAAGGFPDQPVMEDVVLVRRLKRRGRIALVDAAVRTSARRWLARGICRTTLANQACLVGHAMGVSTERLARWRGMCTES